MFNQKFWQFTYSSLVLPGLILALKIISTRNKKLRDTLQGHQGVWERIENQLKTRDLQKPLVWFHVASAGEYLQALPVMERLMAAEIQCALTITSVSGYRWANKRKANYSNLVLLDYLPLDTKANMQRLIKCINPNAVVYVKFDLWPNLIWEIKKANIPQFLISATLQEKSKRVTNFIARNFYDSIYKSLTRILAVTDDDKKRFLQCSPELNNVKTVGDTRFDSVLDRKKNLNPPELPGFDTDKPVLILGSVWPSDEHHIFTGILKALNTFSDLNLIIAPHETDEEHIKAIEETFSDFQPCRFTQLQSQADKTQRIIIIDAVGFLSSLYLYADVAYVGGAFSTGVHNTMEPAAMGVPSIFGPFYQNSPEAMNMVKNEVCFSIKNSQEFEKILFKLLEDKEYCMGKGQAATTYIDQQAGASDACFAEIKETLA